MSTVSIREAMVAFIWNIGHILMIVVAPTSKEAYPPAVQRAFPTMLLAAPSSSYVYVKATRQRVVVTRS